MCSIIESGEKGYKLHGQILFNFLTLLSTLEMLFRVVVAFGSKVKSYMGCDARKFFFEISEEVRFIPACLATET